MLYLWLKSHDEGWGIEAEEIVAVKQCSLLPKTELRECIRKS